MNLINKEITHKVFGEGNVVDQDASFITVDFKDEVKKFVYPDAFRSFLTLNNEEAAEELDKIIEEEEIKAAKIEKQREKERAREMLERQRQDMLKNNKIHESSQVVLWLDEEEKATVFDDWLVSIGTVQSGKNKGRPNRAPRLRPNSASLLTVREADQDETERRIIGIYMVDEFFLGDECEDGMIQPHDAHRITLTEEESEKMLFWNYYINKNYPERTSWNSGKYRYYDNIWTAQILKDILAMRTDEAEKEAIKEFLTYFCEMNVIDIENIPEPAGALKHAAVEA